LHLSSAASVNVPKLTIEQLIFLPDFLARALSST
jgi:hypothetical protein